MYTEFWWGKPLGKWSLERLQRIWKDNIKMNLMEAGCESRKWMEMSQQSVQ
jgi:hypothetical protein